MILQRSIAVRCSAENAFEAFTRHIDEWWPKSHRRFAESKLVMDPEMGGRLFEQSADGEEALLGQVVRWDPPRRVTYTWFPGASASAPTEVDVTFTAQGEQTLVQVAHGVGKSAPEQWSERVARFERGWGALLPALRAYVE